MRELVSVLMSIYNEPVRWISTSVESIIHQTYLELELIIVVDDPNNIKALEYLQSIANEYDNIAVICNEKTMGLVASLNKGLQYCHGRYIARMDADDIAFDKRIESQVRYLKKYNYDIVGTFVQAFTDNTEERWFSCCSFFACRKLLRVEGGLAHPSWLMKREVYECLGGYRNIEACEDYDFLVRAVLKKFKIGNVPNHLLKYRINPNGISSTKGEMQRWTAALIARQYRSGLEVDIEEYNRCMEEQNWGIPQSTLIVCKIYRKILLVLDGFNIICRRRGT